MPGRAAKFVPAIFVNILAGLLLTTVASSEPVTTEGCLSAPWGDAPAGSHWRYHIDHANKRNCWFLRRDGGGALSQASPQNNTAAPQEITPPAPAAPPPPAKPSIADARAEFRPKDNSVPNPPANAAGYPSNTGVGEASPATAPAWNATAAVATRWPDPPVAPVASPAPSAAPATTTVANDTRQPSADPSQAILPSIPFTRLTVPMQPGTIAGVIAATIVALAFVALFTKRKRTRRVRRRFVRSGRSPLWETTDDDRIVLSDHPNPDGRGYRFAHGVPNASHRARESARRPPPRRASR